MTSSVSVSSSTIKSKCWTFAGLSRCSTLVRLNEERRQQEPSPFEVLLVTIDR